METNTATRTHTTLGILKDLDSGAGPSMIRTTIRRTVTTLAILASGERDSGSTVEVLIRAQVNDGE